MTDIREQIAAFCHNQWSGWMEYLFEKSVSNADGTVTIPKWAVERWLYQSATQYVDLRVEEQDSDRTEADKFLALPIKTVTEKCPGVHAAYGDLVLNLDAPCSKCGMPIGDKPGTVTRTINLTEALETLEKIAERYRKHQKCKPLHDLDLDDLLKGWKGER